MATNIDKVTARLLANPALAHLPSSLTDEHRMFWNDFIGEPFQNHIGPRGKKSGSAKSYTRSQFVGPFCDKFYPNLSADLRSAYEDIIGPRVYSYLTNHSTRGTSGVQKKSQVVKSRVYACDIWKREDPEDFRRRMDEHEAENPDQVLNVGTRRSLEYKLFAQLPDAEQKLYRQKAADSLQTLRGLQRLNGEDKKDYIQQFVSQLDAIMKEGDKCAGIKLNVQVVYEDDDRDFHIVTLMSDSMSELEDCTELDQFIQRVKGWVKERAGKNVVNLAATLTPTAYPDYEHDMYPLVPDIVGMRVADLQKLLRVVFSLLWVWMGGQGKFPWELVCGDLDAWIPAHRRPAVATLADPSSLRHAQLVTWLEYMRDCQSGVIPLDRRIQFSRVYAGLSPIDDALSQESTRYLEYIPQQARETWVLEFTDTVTRCHAPGGMRYPENCVEFGKFLKRGEVAAWQEAAEAAEALALPTKPAEFLELPTGDVSPSTVIDGQEKALILKLADGLPDLYRTPIFEIVDSVNTHQAHSPASTPSGLWAGDFATRMPAQFPSSPEDSVNGLQLILRFWAHVGLYMGSINAPLTWRFVYLRLCIEDFFTSPLIRHQPSQTLIGNYNGIVWIGRVIILLILNFAAINGDFGRFFLTLTPPHEPPPGYDLTKLPSEELTHVLGWARMLIEMLKASTAILARTSHARRSYLEPVAQPQDPVPGPIADSPQSPADGTSPSADTSAHQPLPALPSNTEPSERRRQKSKQPAKPKARQTDTLDVDSREMSPRVSDESDAEKNYDEMDGGSDNDSLNPDGFSFDPTEADPPSSPLEGRFARLNAGFEDETQTTDRSTRELQKEFGDLFNSDPRRPAHVFGPLLALPPSPRPPSFPTYEAIFSAIQTEATKIEGAIRGWHELIEPNATGLAGNIANARRDSKVAPASLQPLIYFLLARRREWECAKVTAPIAIKVMAHLALNARAGLQLDAAVGEFWDVGDHMNTVGDAERAALDKLHRRLLKAVVETCWIYKELLDFEKLSTEWSGALPSDWLTSDPLTLGSALGHLVLQLADWAEAASELDIRHHSLRKRMWIPVGRPFESKQRTLLAYRFGSPHPQEISDGLKEWLKYAKEDDEEEIGKENTAKGIRGATSANSVPNVSPPVSPSANLPAPVDTPVDAASDISPPIAQSSTMSHTASGNAGVNGSSTPENRGSELPHESSDNVDPGANVTSTTSPQVAADVAGDATADVVTNAAVPVVSPPSASHTSKKSKATKVAATPRLTRNNAAAAAATAAAAAPTVATATTTTTVAAGSTDSVSSRTRRANTKTAAAKAASAGTSKKGSKRK
ncbi:hypothetical protein FRC12_003179 [Ceratobasidium sp. 428]|nr:hypothetical protein FRC12_003179 [Ceratobasidium sp. 428]